ncbi:MAG: FecR domain-containing protein [Steroidobacteraceae bacterium]
MTLESDIEHERRIAEQAAFLLLTLQSEDLTPEQRAELVEWLCESSRHVSALFRVCRLQRDLSRFSKWRQIAPLHAAPPPRIMRLVPGRGASSPPPRVPRGRAVALAVCLAAACVAAWLLIAPPGQREFGTQAGERREITLADGSVMDLSPHTEVAVRYRTRERLIDLEQGEALFHVAKNRDRPFIVESANTRVRAVGTVFRVQRTTRNVCVTVVEGLVAVSEEPRGWHAITPLRPTLPLLSLAANEQVSINLAGVVSPVHWVEAITTGSAPAANQLLFQDQTVADIARRFNLHNRIQIEISDPALAARRISGIFRADDPQSFVAFLQVAADVKVSQRDPTHILLGPRLDSNTGPAH